MHRVVYYLAFIVDGRDRLMVAFPVRAKDTEAPCNVNIPCMHVMHAQTPTLTCRMIIKQRIQRLQPELEDLLPVYERLRPLVAAARAGRNASSGGARATVG